MWLVKNGDFEMSRKINARLTALLFIAALLSATFLAGTASAIVPQNVRVWYWGSDTNAASVVTADVDGDGGVEIVTGGYYNDGMRWNAQLAVWNGTTMALERVQPWFWTSNTQVVSIAAGDVDGDSGVEIVTGGSYFDGTRWVAQLAVWNGSTLALENVQVWYWTSNTQIASVAFGDVDGDGGTEIVTGGSYNDGTRWVAQLAVWNGSTLASENVKTWFWNSNTYINSVAVGNVDADPAVEIVSGGAYFDGVRYNAQLAVWTGALAVKSVNAYYWTGNTDVTSVVAGDVDADGGVEIVTGGSYDDTTRYNAQLVVWNGSTMAVENVKTWYFTSDTYISSVAYGDVNGDGPVEIVTGGKYFDGTRYNAQLTVQPGATLIGNAGTNWYWTSHTYVESIAISNLSGAGSQIVTSGAYFDNTRVVAQVTVWG
jgi:hypothetical protein